MNTQVLNRKAFVKGYNMPQVIAFVNRSTGLAFVEADDCFIPIPINDIFWLKSISSLEEKYDTRNPMPEL